MSLTVCDNSHEEIVYNHNIFKSGCPLCLANEIIDNLQENINLLESRIDELEEILAGIE